MGTQRRCPISEHRCGNSRQQDLRHKGAASQGVLRGEGRNPRERWRRLRFRGDGSVQDIEKKHPGAGRAVIVLRILESKSKRPNCEQRNVGFAAFMSVQLHPFKPNGAAAVARFVCCRRRLEAFRLGRRRWAMTRRLRRTIPIARMPRMRNLRASLERLNPSGTFAASSSGAQTSISANTARDFQPLGDLLRAVSAILRSR